MGLRARGVPIKPTEHPLYLILKPAHYNNVELKFAPIFTVKSDASLPPTHTHRPVLTKTSYCRPFFGTETYELTIPAPSDIEQSWRNVLITEPPITEVELRIDIEAREKVMADFEIVRWQFYTNVVNSQKGLTVRDVDQADRDFEDELVRKGCDLQGRVVVNQFWHYASL